MSCKEHEVILYFSFFYDFFLKKDTTNTIECYNVL